MKFKALFLVVFMAFIAVQIGRADDNVQLNIEHDNYQKRTTILTKSIGVKSSFFTMEYAHAYLCGVVTDDGREGYSLTLNYTSGKGNITGSSWMFFSSAHDADGKELLVNVSDQRVSGPHDIQEVFSSPLEKNYLNSHRESGLDIKYSGKNGDMIVKIEPKYVQAVLNEVEKIKGASPTQLTSSLINTSQNKPKLGVNYQPTTVVFANLSAQPPGVKVKPETARLIASITTLGTPRGVVLLSLPYEGIGYRQGLRPDDIILSLNGKAVAPITTGLQDAMAAVKPGDKIILTIWRESHEMQVPIQF